jgi:hypothetical protein
MCRLPAVEIEMRTLLALILLALVARPAGAAGTVIACKDIRGVAIEPDGTTSPDGYSGFTLRLVVRELDEGPFDSLSASLGARAGGEALALWDDDAWPMHVAEATRLSSKP